MGWNGDDPGVGMGLDQTRYRIDRDGVATILAELLTRETLVVEQPRSFEEALHSYIERQSGFCRLPDRRLRQGRRMQPDRDIRPRLPRAMREWN